MKDINTIIYLVTEYNTNIYVNGRLVDAIANIHIGATIDPLDIALQHIEDITKEVRVIEVDFSCDSTGMMTEDEYEEVTYLTEAQQEALLERNCRIFELAELEKKELLESW